MSAAQRRPRVVALGGGTGLASLLRGLKHEHANLTAIVTVADDGGSSGRLRRELGILPPGDIRNCLVALADDESLMGTLFQHRFVDGELSGHSFGNLFLAALTEVTGEFDTAIAECSRVLKIRGKVLPSTLAHARLWAERADGEHVCGESRIAAGSGPCARVWLDPVPDAHPAAVREILRADLVVLGPGSLFTSVLPHLAVPDIADALARTDARRAYVCNVMTQPGETDAFDAAAHVETVLAAAPGALDAVVVHEGPLDPSAAGVYAASGQDPVLVDRARIESLGVAVVGGDVADSGSLVRHRPERLASLLMDVLRAAEPAGR